MSASNPTPRVDPPDTSAPGYRRYGYPMSDDIEDIERYVPGGFHPVDLGAQLDDNRYLVLHKLGYGASSTVWLARDSVEKIYVALKIVAADCSEDAMEVHNTILSHLKRYAGRYRGQHIDLPLRQFWIQGPNGRHLCIVSKVAGPSIAKLSHAIYMNEAKPLGAKRAKRAAIQLTRTLAFLHSKDVSIVHGDLTSNNILFELENIDTWPLGRLLSLLEEPVKEVVRVRPTDLTGKTEAPKFMYEPANVMKFLPYCTGNIKLIDFGTSFFLDIHETEAEDSGTPICFCSPELLQEGRSSKASDVWALGCTIFEIWAGDKLFTSFMGSGGEVLGQMESLLGPLPPSKQTPANQNDVEEESAGEKLPPLGTAAELDHNLQAHAEEAHQAMPDADKEYLEGQPDGMYDEIEDTYNEGLDSQPEDMEYLYGKQPTLKELIEEVKNKANTQQRQELGLRWARAYNLVDWLCEVVGVEGSRISEAEANAFHDFLRLAFCYDTKKRASAEELLRHGWLYWNSWIM